ncbi:MAG: FixH family protein [Pseudomonadota bacterium]
MVRPLPLEDTQPWYQQFWPWFLIALPGSVVIAAFATLYIANRHSDDMVVADYYKEGLAINERIADVERAARLGISADLEFSPAIVTARLTGKVTEPSLLLLLSHPMEADRDIEIRLARVGPGRYQGNLPLALSHRWHWSLLHEGEAGWRLDGTLRLN